MRVFLALFLPNWAFSICMKSAVCWLDSVSDDFSSLMVLYFAVRRNQTKWQRTMDYSERWERISLGALKPFCTAVLSAVHTFRHHAPLSLLLTQSDGMTQWMSNYLRWGLLIWTLHSHNNDDAHLVDRERRAHVLMCPIAGSCFSLFFFNLNMSQISLEYS